MREIKFRILLAGVWHYWGFIDDGHGLAFRGLPSSNADSMTMEDAQKRSQQFTGLKDKNGKEIYAGDITPEGIVAWHDELTWEGGGSPHPGFYLSKGFEYGDTGDMIYHSGFDDKIEIIGNIYEHSHLLKEEAVDA